MPCFVFASFRPIGSLQRGGVGVDRCCAVVVVQVSLQVPQLFSPLADLVCVRFDKQTGVGGVRGNRTGDVFCLACQSVSL